MRSNWFMYMMIAATLFANYPKDERMYYVRRYYDSSFLKNSNIPNTSSWQGCVLIVRQFAKNVLLTVTTHLIPFPGDMSTGRYTAQRAGICINAGRNEEFTQDSRRRSCTHRSILLKKV